MHVKLMILELELLEDVAIRAIAEELVEERKGFPEGTHKSDHDLSTMKKKADLGRPDYALK